MIFETTGTGTACLRRESSADPSAPHKPHRTDQDGRMERRAADPNQTFEFCIYGLRRRHPALELVVVGGSERRWSDNLAPGQYTTSRRVGDNVDRES